MEVRRGDPFCTSNLGWLRVGGSHCESVTLSSAVASCLVSVKQAVVGARHVCQYLPGWTKIHVVYLQQKHTHSCFALERVWVQKELSDMLLV